MFTLNSQCDQIQETQTMIDEMCRPEKKEELCAIVQHMGRQLILFGMQKGLTFDEMLCAIYVLSNAMNMAIDVYEDNLGGGQ